RHFEQNGNLTDHFTLLVPGTPALQSRSFKQNVNGYTGARDVELREDGSVVSPTAPTVKVAADDSTAAGAQRAQSPLRFADLFGIGAAQVPLGVKIASAVLRMTVTDAGSGFSIHRMLGGWDDATATW